MPRGDGTGPAGRGPRSGRGLGNRAAYGAPAYLAGGGRGGGHGWRHWYYATGVPCWARAGYQPAGAGQTREVELDLLQAQAGQLKTTLAGIEARMEQLKASEVAGSE